MTVKRWYAQRGVEQSKTRAKTGEVFTPEAIGMDMIEMVVARDPQLINGTFLDPSCGDGNLLLCVLKQKIAAGIHPYQALETLYGIEIEKNNVDRCCNRLVEYVIHQLPDDDDVSGRCAQIINSVSGSRYFPRIVCYDALAWDVENWKPVGYPSVLNAHIVGTNLNSNQVYVGRPSKWGNPFVIGRDGSRIEVIEKYSVWLIDHPELLTRVDELRGKDLICWCAPDKCHADILIQLANH